MNLSVLIMKKNLLAAFLLASPVLFAQQLPVSQNPEMKKVLIEEFTAYKCGNCPAGHEAARIIGENLGEENVLVIGYHYGSLASPDPGLQDFRTPDGNSLGSFFGIVGTPMGPVNRGNFGSSNFVLSANQWSVNAATIRTQPADANVALDVNLDGATRVATIDVEVFYTANSANTHYLTVGYTENGVVGQQTTYNSAWNADFFNMDGTYNHQHVFRGFVTSHEGNAIDASTTGVISNNFTFTVPADHNGHTINIDNLEFFVILHEGENGPTNSAVINVAKTGVTATVGIDELAESLTINALPNPSHGTFNLQGLNSDDVIQIYDISGRAVDFNRENEIISIDQNGLFLIQISGPNGFGTTRVVVE